MIRITIILAAMLVVGCARPAYVVRSDAENAYMRGRVEQLRETYITDRAGIHGSSVKFDTYTVVDYNRAGNITRMDVFNDPDSVHVAREEYFYDPTGRLLERSVSHNPLKDSYSATRYTYDGEGRLIRETDESRGWHVDLGYNRRGYLKTRVDTTSNPKRALKTRYRYDRFGRLRVERSVGGNDPTQKHSYHADGTTIAETRYGKTVVYSYDERGNLVGDTHIIKKMEMRREKLRAVGSYPMTLTARYEYDAHGNWIRREQLYDGEIQGLFLREIDYYDE